MEEVRASLDSVPEVSTSRVAELRELINSGNYEPNLDQVANGLIEEAILRSLQ
jgi:flagellar biosynthesis anti-sigma factor FlgM